MRPRSQETDPGPPPAEVEAAFAAIAAEARAALWLGLVERQGTSELAEMIGITEEGMALIAAGGAAEILERLSRRGWAIRVEELAGLLAALAPPEPPAGLRERILARLERYFS